MNMWISANNSFLIFGQFPTSFLYKLYKCSKTKYLTWPSWVYNTYGSMIDNMYDSM